MVDPGATGAGQIVHTVDDRWIGVNSTVFMAPTGCEASPVLDTGGRISGWRAPCTGATYEVDGTCAGDSATCYVGLSTFPVKVENGRLLDVGNPTHDTPGVPSRLVTG